MNFFTRRFLAVSLIIVVVVVGGMQARRGLRNAKAQRLTAEAIRRFKTNDYADALRCVHDALNHNPSSIEATKLTAELLENTGSPSALSWRIRASQLQPTDMMSRLDWAQTAVRLRDSKSAEEALSGLDETALSTARYHKVAGALAWSQGKTDEAEKHYRQALGLEPDNPSNLLNLSTIGLVSTNEEEASTARLTLQALAATNGPHAANALRFLTQDATKRANVAEALRYSGRLVTNSAASFADKIENLNLLTGAQSPESRSWLTVLKQQATNSPESCYVLGRWIFRNEGPTNALSWIASVSGNLKTNQPLPLLISESQIASKDWAGLLTTVEGQDWHDSEVLRLGLEALARRSLGEEDAAQTSWKRARRHSARRLDQLYQLVQLSSAWGWTSEAREVLMEVVTEFPQEKWAAELLVAQLHDSGATQELEELLLKLSEADPRNFKLKSSLARICLLRNTKLEKAHRLAKEAFDRANDDPLIVSTYAYSLLLQGNEEQAIKVLELLQPEALQIPWVATCYGFIEAKSGNKQAAREPLERAQAAKLLPEEMALVRSAAAN